MTLRTLLWWALHIVVAILLFVIVKWLVDFLAGLLGIGLPEAVAIAIALLVAICYLLGWVYWPRRGGVVV